MKPESLEAALGSLGERIAAQLESNLEGVLLCGSRAEGCEHPDSDVDGALILSGGEVAGEALYSGTLESMGRELPCDLHLFWDVESDQIASEGDLEQVRAVSRAKIVMDRSGKAEQMVCLARRRIQEEVLALRHHAGGLSAEFERRQLIRAIAQVRNRWRFRTEATSGTALLLRTSELFSEALARIELLRLREIARAESDEAWESILFALRVRGSRVWDGARFPISKEARGILESAGRLDGVQTSELALGMLDALEREVSGGSNEPLIVVQEGGQESLGEAV